MSKWFEKEHADGIALSSYVTISRNAAGYPFGDRLPAEKAEELVAAARKALEGANCREYGKDTSVADFAELAADRVIDPDYADADLTRAVFVSPEGDLSVSSDKERHFCIRKSGCGLCLEELYKAAAEIEDRIGEGVTFAFDEKLGFLSRNPEDLGCGLQAGVLLHLPMLTERGSIRVLTVGAAKLGITLRSGFGENAEALGNVYEVTNQYSLGLSEQEVLRRVREVAEQVIREEQKLRDELKEADAVALEDRAARAAGVLASARRISTAEAMELLSDVRLGRALGLSDALSAGEIDRLYAGVLPGVLDPEEKLTATKRSEARADLIRAAFRK